MTYELFETSSTPNSVVWEFESEEANVAVLNHVTVALLSQLTFPFHFSFGAEFIKVQKGLHLQNKCNVQKKASTKIQQSDKCIVIFTHDHVMIMIKTPFSAPF